LNLSLPGCFEHGHLSPGISVAPVREAASYSEIEDGIFLIKQRHKVAEVFFAHMDSSLLSRRTVVMLLRIGLLSAWFPVKMEDEKDYFRLGNSTS
jgi:hypothetical protein